MSYDDRDWGPRTLGPTSYGSVLERRDVLWNDGNPAPPAAPPAIYTGVTHYSKFFTRGCRGKLDYLEIYCIRTAAGTLDISFSPHPCLGPLYTVTVTPGAAWAWVVQTFYEMWNYDSMFLWVSRCDADVSYGADFGTPYDGHRSTDGGATWAALDRRFYIRAHMYGETPGDVPISGIVNTIEIPAVAGEVAAGNAVACASGGYTVLCEADGAGTLNMVKVWGATPVVPGAIIYYDIYVEVDELTGVYYSNRDCTQSYVAARGRSSCGEFYLDLDADPTEMRMNLRMPIKFRRHIELHFFQNTGAGMTMNGRIYANMQR